MRNIHFAFRPDGDAFVGGHDTYRARHDAGGLAVTPVGGQPLHLATARFFRSGAVLRGEGPAMVESDGHLSIAGEGVIEHVRNGEEGCEQSWTFTSKPAGVGALTLRIATRGLHHIATTATGLHFEGEHHRGVRYGHATFVDAAGARTKIDAQWVAGDIVLTVPASIVEGASYPATLDPTISPEIELDKAPASLSGAGDSPDVAVGGGEFLVVWMDTRGGTNDIYGARVSTAGVLLDALPILISTAADGQVFPRVAYDGTNFVVAWQDRRDGVTNAIYAARVTTAGVVLEPTGVQISAAGSNPSIASSGGNSLIAWQGGASGAQAMRVSTTLALVDAAPIDLNCVEPAVAYDGVQYMVACTRKTSATATYGTIHGVRITTAGTVLDPTGIKIGSTTSQRLPSIAAEGTMFLVAWEDTRTSSTSDIYAARVTAAGAVADATGFAVTSTTGTAERAPSLAFDGANFVVTWNVSSTFSSPEVWIVRVSTAGALFDPAAVKIASSSSSPRVVSDGTRSMLTWRSDSRIVATRLSAITPSDVPAISVSKVGNGQNTPAAAWDGDEWLVVWSDNRPTTFTVDFDLYATRVSKTGTVLDPSGILISNAARQQISPSVAFNGTEFYVVWSDARDGVVSSVFPWAIYGVRVSKSGTLVAGSEKKMLGNFSGAVTAKVVSDGATYSLFANTDGNLRGFPFNYDGTLLAASGFVVSTTGGLVDAIHDGTRYYMVWQETVSSTDTNIKARSMTSAGAMGAVTTVTAAVGKQFDAAVAYDGASGYLVVWTDNRDGDTNIYGARVSTAGTVADPFGIAISKATGDQTLPAVIFDGTEYVAAWQDLRGSSSDIYGARISTAGVVLDPTGFSISGATGAETEPVIVRGDAGKALIAYGAYNPKYGSVRVVARTYGTTLATGGACTTSGDCGGGPCVDGVCCDTACGGGATNDCQACSVAAGGAVDGTCGPVKATTVCRASAGPCDVAEKCDGVALTCPVDGFAVDGTSCDDGLVCNGVSSCVSGVCTAGTAPSCDDGDGCTVDTCAEPSGCTHTPIASCDAGTDAESDSTPDTASADSATADTIVASDTSSEADSAAADTIVVSDTSSEADSAGEDTLAIDSAPTETDSGSAEVDAAAAEAPAADSSGCGCEVPRSSRGAGTSFALAAMILALARRRARAGE